jgi:hypothetical protein
MWPAMDADGKGVSRGGEKGRHRPSHVNLPPHIAWNMRGAKRMRRQVVSQTAYSGSSATWIGTAAAGAADNVVLETNAPFRIGFSDTPGGA